MLLSRYYTPVNLHILLNLLVLSVVIYTGVDIFYTLAGSKLTEVKTEQITSKHFKGKPTQGKRRSFDHYVSAINRNFFGEVEEAVKEAAGELQVDDLEATTLNISLLGTVSGDQQSAVAIIQERAKKTQSLLKEGDTIQNATIAKILRGKVVLRVGTKNQILTMEEKPRSSTRGKWSGGPSPASPIAASTITLDRSTVTKSLQNISELLSRVRVRQVRASKW
jgi:general secretion pathway protein C